MSMGQKYDADIPESHSFRETRDLRPKDQKLRRHGFRIERRPRVGEPVWSLAGTLMVESATLPVADAAEQEQRQRGLEIQAKGTKR